MDPRYDHVGNLVAHLRALGKNSLTLDGAQLAGMAHRYCRSGHCGDAYVHALLIEHPDHDPADSRNVLALRMRTPAGIRMSEAYGVRRRPSRYAIRWTDAQREVSLDPSTYGLFVFDICRLLLHNKFVPDSHASHLSAPPILQFIQSDLFENR